MLTTIKSALIAATIGLTALTATPVGAQAEGIYFSLGTHDGYGERWGDNRYERGFEVRHRERYRPRHGCSPERAARKAERLGLHRVRVVDVSRRTVTVRGRAFGDRVRLTFARAPGCPIIGRS